MDVPRPPHVLQALDITGSKTPHALFDAYRTNIYAAAAQLVQAGDPRRQQTLAGYILRKRVCLTYSLVTEARDQ